MDSSQALYKGGTDETCDEARCGKKRMGILGDGITYWN
jgi:hypothetical protein